MFSCLFLGVGDVAIVRGEGGGGLVPPHVVSESVRPCPVCTPVFAYLSVSTGRLKEKGDWGEGGGSMTFVLVSILRCNDL